MSLLVVSDRANIETHKRPWWQIGVSATSNPFQSMGLRWCPVCRGEEDTDQEARHKGSIYLYKITCKRCGSVVGFGAFNNVPLIVANPLPPMALSWVKAPGRDRR